MVYSDKDNKTLDDSQAPSGTEVSVETIKTYTIEEMAKELSKDVSTISRRISELGLKPICPAVSSKGIKARFSYECLVACMDKDVQLRQKHLETVKKHVAALSQEERAETVRETYDSLDLNGKMKFALDAIAVTLQAWNKHNEELQVLTDQHKEWISVLRWNKEMGLGLDMKGAQALGVAMSKYCKEHQIPVEKVKALDPTGRYEWVNAYHITAWEAYWDKVFEEEEHPQQELM